MISPPARHQPRRIDVLTPRSLRAPAPFAISLIGRPQPKGPERAVHGLREFVDLVAPAVVWLAFGRLHLEAIGLPKSSRTSCPSTVLSPKSLMFQEFLQLHCQWA